MSPLEDVLALAGVRGSISTSISAGERWGLQLAAVPEAAFHAVTKGVAYLTVPGNPTVRMTPGDVILLPRGSAHTFASDRDVPTVPFDRLAYARSHQPGQVLEIGQRPSPTEVLCAFYSHNATTNTPLFALLPELIYVPAEAGNGQIARTIRLMADESARPGMASATILDRLTDVLLIQILRQWTQANEFTQSSWLRGMTDSAVEAALTAMHADPARDWTLEDLAAAAHVSRATLSRRFTKLVGQPPSAYLTSWRMDLAAQRLRESEDRAHEIGHAVGYTSEFAFSRAFARAFGQPPRRYRETFRAPAGGSPGLSG
ncbi:MAG TPA: AraC family transcriptional regulator [Streptosporangiaceae bacterium]|nr:AraC family transcriptional regulator [Streptosporangiaceae bacterium]